MRTEPAIFKKAGVAHIINNGFFDKKTFGACGVWTKQFLFFVVIIWIERGKQIFRLPQKVFAS